MKQHTKLLIGLVCGIVFGLLLHPYAGSENLNAFNTHFIQPVGQVFLRLIFMVVVPLIFSALVLGVMELGEGHGLGRVAWRTLMFTLIASSFSVLIGVSLVNIVEPGKGFYVNQETIMEQAKGVEAVQKNAAEAKPFSTALVELIPRNPVDSAARAFSGEIIALMVFALIFGLALSQTSGKKGALHEAIEQLYAVSMKVIEYAMYIAPFGVFALVFGTVFKFGQDILKSLAIYVVLVVGGLLIQQFGVYSLLLTVFARRSPLKFFAACREVYLYAFSTASSNATLPKSLDTAERVLGLSPKISRFVLTVGSTANQNGTALFEGITVLFLAQVYNIDLTLAQQVQVVLMSILAGIGTAGIPGGSLPLIMILLQTLGIPPEGLGLILGVDRFLDMCRTTINVSGDLVIAALVDDTKRGEKT
ncbi:MAG TPA: dicarboxylate/amino acid:cation symporter [Bdellovibrionales bacterium]|nr:dicarboxylate/amino acid:cation symporter [Bdellovibrionales bacterium]